MWPRIGRTSEIARYWPWRKEKKQLYYYEISLLHVQDSWSLPCLLDLPAFLLSIVAAANSSTLVSYLEVRYTVPDASRFIFCSYTIKTTGAYPIPRDSALSEDILAKESPKLIGIHICLVKECLRLQPRTLIHSDNYNETSIPHTRKYDSTRVHFTFFDSGPPVSIPKSRTITTGFFSTGTGNSSHYNNISKKGSYHRIHLSGIHSIQVACLIIE